MSLVSHAGHQCDFSFELITVGRRFLSVSRWGPLSERGARGFEHNAARSTRSEWIQARNTNTNRTRIRERSRGLNLRHQLSCAPEIDVLPTAPWGWSKHPTRCACVRGGFQNPRFLPLKRKTNVSIMCTTNDNRGKLSKDSVLSQNSRVPRIAQTTFDPLCRGDQWSPIRSS